VYLKSILKSESYFLSQPLARFSTPWIVREADLAKDNDFENNFSRVFEDNLNGYDPANARDFNEEY
jgi:hypothetical protein